MLGCEPFRDWLILKRVMPGWVVPGPGVQELRVAAYRGSGLLGSCSGLLDKG
jgi:hypothetical protein